MKYFHPEELALLAAIHAEPREDTPRLVYADWLQEHDESEYAEFIRLSIHNAHKSITDHRCTALRKAHGRRWCSPKPSCLKRGTYRRGLPVFYLEPTRLGPAHHLTVLDRMSPRIRLILNLHDDAMLGAWCASNFFDRVAQIQLYCIFGNRQQREITVDGIIALANASNISKVEKITIDGRMTDQAMIVCNERLAPLVPVEHSLMPR